MICCETGTAAGTMRNRNPEGWGRYLEPVTPRPYDPSGGLIYMDAKSFLKRAILIALVSSLRLLLALGARSH